MSKTKVQESLERLAHAGVDLLSLPCDEIIAAIVNDQTDSGREFERTIIVPGGFKILQKDAVLSVSLIRFRESPQVEVYHMYQDSESGITFISLSDSSVYEVYHRFSNVPRERKGMLRGAEDFLLTWYDQIYGFKKPDKLSEVMTRLPVGNTLLPCLLPPKPGS